MSSTYRQSLEAWLKELDVKAGAVIDVGGAQLPVKDRVRSWDVEQYIIADLESPHADSPKPNVVLDLNEPIDVTPYYDLVFCLEVFDYIYDPVRAILNIRDLLKPGAKAYVSFPAFYPHHNPVEHDSLLYKEYGIRKLANVAGLDIAQMIPRRPTTNALQQFFSAEGLRAAKGYDHNVMGWIVDFKR